MNTTSAAYAYLLWLKERGLRFPTPATLASPAKKPSPLQSISPKVDWGFGGAQPRVIFITDGIFEEIKSSESVLRDDERELLEKMIDAMRLRPEEVFVTSIVPTRLDQNTPLSAAAKSEALKKLQQQVHMLRPEMAVIMGMWSCRALLGEMTHFPSIRGRFGRVASLGGLPALVTYHPRDLLRFPANKRHTWGDLQVVMAKLGVTATH